MKSYTLSDGLQESLQASLATHLKSHVDDWTRQVEEAEIDEESLAVFVAVGWIPSKRDSRLTLVEPETEE